MCGTDAVLALADGLVHDVLLGKHHFLEGQFHAKVAPSNHDAIRAVYDLVNVDDGLVVFDLANKVDVGSVHWVLGDEVLSELNQIFPSSGEGDSDVVDLVMQSKVNNIHLVFLLDGGEVNVHTRQTHVLLVPQLAVIKNFNSYDAVLNLAYNRRHSSIGKQDLFAHSNRGCYLLIGSSNSLRCPQMAVIGCLVIILLLI